MDVDQLAARLLLIRAHLDERAWRLLLGAEAKVLGRGGIKVVAGAVKGSSGHGGPGSAGTGLPGPDSRAGAASRWRAPVGGGHRPHVVGGVGRIGGPGDSG